MAELYQKDLRTINEHIQNLLADGEISGGNHPEIPDGSTRGLSRRDA